MSNDNITKRVREFYEQLPFNYYSTQENAVKSIKAKNSISYYVNLHKILSNGAVGSVLDVGCGSGWFANSVAHYYRLRVKAFDFTKKVIERARSVAGELGIDGLVDFSKEELFSYNDTAKYDLVNSIGVLHHTYDCKKAFKHISAFVCPKKYIHIGLYHLHGRRIFLDHFKKVLEENGEEAAFKLYMELNPKIKDETFGKSWFRDQVLHPHETQHTLEEVLRWFDEEGFEFLSTSINNFEAAGSPEELFEMEKRMSDISRRRNLVEKRYYPGFFSVLGRKILQK